MSRAALKVHFSNPSPNSAGSYVEIDGKPVYVTSIEFVAKPGQLVEAFVGFHPDSLTVDVDVGCLRLNGAQLPEVTGRALLAQLQALYK